MNSFDPRLANEVKVSFRDGKFYVFDGAHTLSALKRIHGEEAFMVDCKVYYGLSYEDEAYLFALQSGESKDVAFNTRLRALMISGSQEATDFRAHTAQAGFQLADGAGSATKNTIAAIAKAYRLYKEYGPEQYVQILQLIYDTWNGAAWSVTGYLLGGVAVFLREYGEEYSRRRFIKRLRSATYKTLRDADAVGIPADNQPEAVGLFAAPGAVVEQHADDFIALVQVDMGDFTLRAAHGAGVDLIAPAQQFGDFLSECAVDIVLVHDSTSFSFGSCGSRDPLRGFGSCRRASSGGSEVLVEAVDHQGIVPAPLGHRVQQPLLEGGVGVELVGAEGSAVTAFHVRFQVVSEDQPALNFKEFAVAEGFPGGDGHLAVAIGQTGDFVRTGHKHPPLDSEAQAKSMT